MFFLILLYSTIALRSSSRRLGRVGLRKTNSALREVLRSLTADSQKAVASSEYRSERAIGNDNYDDNWAYCSGYGCGMQGKATPYEISICARSNPQTRSDCPDGYRGADEASVSSTECPEPPAFATVNGGARVGHDEFMDSLGGLFSGTEEENVAYHEYLESLFFMGTSMMIEEKTDLGKHCFTAASELVSEFYGFPQCHHTFLSAKCMSPPRFEEVNGGSRIDHGAFISALQGLFTSDVPEEVSAWHKYLRSLFFAGLDMMIEEKTDLGEHCYSNVASLVGDFYGFDFEHCEKQVGDACSECVNGWGGDEAAWTTCVEHGECDTEADVGAVCHPGLDCASCLDVADYACAFYDGTCIPAPNDPAGYKASKFVWMCPSTEQAVGCTSDSHCNRYINEFCVEGQCWEIPMGPKGR